jgi:hypothetical protein
MSDNMMPALKNSLFPPNRRQFGDENVFESEKIGYNVSGCDFVFGYLAKEGVF